MIIAASPHSEHFNHDILTHNGNYSAAGLTPTDKLTLLKIHKCHEQVSFSEPAMQPHDISTSG